MGGQLTMKADVYSFGVLILEVVSGKGSARTNWGGSNKYLLEWVRSFQLPIFMSCIASSFVSCYVTLYGNNTIQPTKSEYVILIPWCS